MKKKYTFFLVGIWQWYVGKSIYLTNLTNSRSICGLEQKKKQLLWNMSLIICGIVFIRWWIYIQYYIICLCFLITQSKMNQVWLTTACEQHVNWYLILCYVTFKFNFSVHGRTAVKVHWKYTTTTTISTLYDNIEYHIYLPNA